MKKSEFERLKARKDKSRKDLSSGPNLREDSCRDYSLEDCRRYIRGNMSSRAMEVFASHCYKCLQCQSNLLEARARMDEQYEEPRATRHLEEKGKGGVFNLLRQRDPENSPNCLIRLAGQDLELLMNSGELMQEAEEMWGAPQGPSVSPSRRRGSPEIALEFEVPPLVLWTVFRVGKWREQQLELSLAVIDFRQKKLLSGAKVTLQGPSGMQQETTTDANGKAALRIQGAGDHILLLESEDVHSFSLTIAVTTD